MDAICSTAQLLALYLQTELTFAKWDAEPSGPLKEFPSTGVQPVRREPEWDPEAADLVEAQPYEHDGLEGWVDGQDTEDAEDGDA